MDACIPLAARAARTQVELMRAGAALLTPSAGTAAAGPVIAVPWDRLWARAGEDLQAVHGRGRQEALSCLWEQIEMVTDLSGQPWWTNPDLQRAALGQIAWSTTLDASVPSSAAQQRWRYSHQLTQTIRRQTRGTLFFGYRGGVTQRLRRLTECWQDAWWTWVDRSLFTSRDRENEHPELSRPSSR